MDHERNLNLEDQSEAMDEVDPSFCGIFQANHKFFHEAITSATASASRRSMLAVKCQAFKKDGRRAAETDDRRREIQDGDGGHHCFCCGVRFKSGKALHGHMRCHPKRSWRGVRPPPSSIARSRPEDMSGRSPSNATSPSGSSKDGEEAQSPQKEVVKALLLLRGERSRLEVDEYVEGRWHQCPKCGRVFATGQSLGGHMRAHYHVEEEIPAAKFEFDLNVMLDTPME